MIEQTIKSERIYDGRVIRVRKDTVRFESGKTGVRDIVEHSGAVAIVAMPDPESVLLVSQYRAAAGETLLEIPAGSINDGEDPLECAKRELVEETQFEAREFERLFEMFSAPGFCTEKLTLFIATNLTAKTGTPDEDEFIDVRTVALDDAVRMIDSGEIRDAKTIAGLLAAARRMGSRA